MLSINNDRRAKLAVLFVAAHRISCGAVLDHYLVMLVVPYLGRTVSLICSAVCVFAGLLLLLLLLFFVFVVVVVVVVLLLFCWVFILRARIYLLPSSCFTSTETIRLIRDGEPRTATSTFIQLLRVFCREGVLL